MSSPFRRLRRVVQRPLAAALPSSCVLCGIRASGPICEACHATYLIDRLHRCPQCANALPLGTGALRCGACQKTPPAFDATLVAVDYAPPLDQLVLSLKFGGQLALAAVFAQCLAETSRARMTAMPTLLTVVPLGDQRLTERGFNQAQEMARPFAAAMGLPLLPRLALRTRETLAQSSLHPDERRRNMRRAFALMPNAGALIQDAHVGIIDDVMTTGETLNELAATFKRHGAARVTNFVFARASH